MKNAIVPAGMSYERAYEIALAAFDFEEREKQIKYDEIKRLNHLGLVDSAIALKMGLPESTVRQVRRVHLKLQPNGPVARAHRNEERIAS